VSDLLIGNVFANAARAVPGRVAVALGNATVSFGELDERANRLARLLTRTGVGCGARVAVWSGTNLDVVTVFAAAAKLGAVFMPVNALLQAGEAADVVGRGRPALLLADDEHAAAAVDIGEASGLPVTTLARCVAAAEAESDEPMPTPAGLGEDDPHVVFFTSGSTGRPKGVVLSHRVNFLRTHPGALLEPRGAMVCPYPLFHMGAWTIALQQWQARDRVVLVQRADAGELLDAIERHRATRLNCVPAVWQRMLDRLDAEPGRDTSTVRFADTGTSATPPELLAAMQRAFPNASVRVFYGSTEAGSVASLEHADVTRKPGSCGVPAPGAEVRLDDGEVCVRGPLLFDGYFDDPEATEAALVDGWYHTGDLAEADAEGYLTIVGRVRDVIRTGGETVAPTEVEAVLAAHPDLADVAVVGLPDSQWGEIVCAVAVVAPGSEPPTVEALREACASSLASYKHPRRLELVDRIPRTAATAQVQRRLLVEQLLARPS
jgi:acyl-CoA synthetase (AMP-forming)/AMP-acid ligase II